MNTSKNATSPFTSEFSESRNPQVNSFYVCERCHHVFNWRLTQDQPGGKRPDGSRCCPKCSTEFVRKFRESDMDEFLKTCELAARSAKMGITGQHFSDPIEVAQMLVVGWGAESEPRPDRTTIWETIKPGEYIASDQSGNVGTHRRMALAKTTHCDDCGKSLDKCGYITSPGFARCQECYMKWQQDHQGEPITIIGSKYLAQMATDEAPQYAEQPKFRVVCPECGTDQEVATDVTMYPHCPCCGERGRQQRMVKARDQ